ncbi:phosphatidylserine/phosphatidylglycerophosphate/cardiolipin synthase family protein [Bdellovibrio sp. NC01]|uniref:phospholipase D-like domain-containing protein n=1 Tax=Bdellovibrio sp. NC01 TaxID=2220073 RepID=UPI00115AD9DE|nr:phospholipase D-like domain-containing protein [Bdellovibrio sp. NC01]QDK38338.1 hypothetical protein DOE51_12485 [Bdellovibrio sp. NC01]
MRILSLVLSAFLFLPLVSSANDTLSIAPEDGHRLFLDNIDAAKSSINMLMYHLSDLDVVNHLISASSRGVKIQIILDEKVMAGGTAKTIADNLQAHGIAVKPSSPFFSISHAKSATFDHSWALVTSINLTRTADFTRDFGIRTDDQDVVNEFDKVFASDWQNADNKTGNTPELSVEKLAWSPVNSKDKLLALIQSAQQSIYLEVENLGDKDILAALGDKSKNDVKVVVVVPACVEGGGTRNVPFMKDLAASGVEAILSVPPYSNSNPYIHAKSIVVDGQTVYVGSENFSYNSLTAARELGIIEQDSDISSSVQNTIAQDASLGKSAQTLPATFKCSVSATDQSP